jgi:hypothetical protein
MCAPQVTRHTRVNMGASIFFSFSKLFIPRTNGLVCRRVLYVLCTKCTLHSNHRLTRVIFQHTKRLLHSQRPFSHYVHSHRLAAEMRTTMKNNLLGKQMLSCSFYLYRFRKYVSYGFSIIYWHLYVLAGLISIWPWDLAHRFSRATPYRDVIPGPLTATRIR